jgi:hypothetical protein
MLLATILLMCPLPQSVDVAKAGLERPAVVSADSTKDSPKDSTPSKTLPAAPEAKIKTDAEIANGANGAAPNSSAPAEAATPANPPAVIQPVKPALHRDYDTEHEKKAWWALTAVSSGAAAFDAWSTRRAISGGYGTEADPMLRPFAHSNAIYAATQVSPLVMDLIGRKMMTSRHNWVRKLWWVPQMAGADVSVSAAIHNVSIVH